MSTFFSGTDTATLRSEGNDTNNFVSLIVNNEGTYSAAITRKVKVSSQVLENCSYNFFGDDAPIVFNNNYNTESQERIEYFMLDIEKEEYENPFSYIDDRFNEIEASKMQISDASSITAPTSPNSTFNTPNSTFLTQHSNEPSLFSEEEMGAITAPDPTAIRNVVAKLLLCSMIINPDKIDVDKWVDNHMVKIYDKTFGSTDSLKFREYLDWVVDYVLDNYDDDVCREVDFTDNNKYLIVLASAIVEELESYNTQNNPYLTEYIVAFSTYCNLS